MVQKTKIRILGGGFGGVSGFVAWWLWRTIYLSMLPRLGKETQSNS